MSTKAILGTFSGECADASITNKNGLDITQPVWENVFNSEDYAVGIEKGWFIGYLGHPHDPGYQNFSEACIVMTSGHIDRNGKVYGEFNLVDTPVGKVVKSFIDAGVEFGISVRGAGDIIDNSVDPDTFVFRGFDLVAFPAYPNAIPTFSEIAASTDLDKQRKYQNVCNAVKTNLNAITSSAALDIMQSQFAKQSEEYEAIEERKHELSEDSSPAEEEIDEDLEPITAEKVRSMTKLYLDKVMECKMLQESLEAAKKFHEETVESNERTLSSLKRIMASQLKHIKSSYIKSSESKSRKILDLKNQNLKYKQEIKSSADSMKSKDSEISRLNSIISETVTNKQSSDERASNLGGQIKSLKADLKKAYEVIASYQQAYGNMYATALGVHLDGIPVTAATSVKELERIISSESKSTSIVDVQNTLPDASDILTDVDDSDIVTL